MMADSLLNVRPQAHRRRMFRARVLGVILHRVRTSAANLDSWQRRPPQKSFSGSEMAERDAAGVHGGGEGGAPAAAEQREQQGMVRKQAATLPTRHMRCSERGIYQFWVVSQDHAADRGDARAGAAGAGGGAVAPQAEPGAAQAPAAGRAAAGKKNRKKVAKVVDKGEELATKADKAAAAFRVGVAQTAVMFYSHWPDNPADLDDLWELLGIDREDVLPDHAVRVSAACLYLHCLLLLCPRFTHNVMACMCVCGCVGGCVGAWVRVGVGGCVAL